jgi:hypothetical protein
MDMPEAAFADLVGETLTRIERYANRQLSFFTMSGKQFRQYHSQECCEEVYIEDICGDLDDLLWSPVLLAEERTNEGKNIPLPAHRESTHSYTWTFYELRTAQASVTIRWFGSSNGYYSESVDFERVA